MAECVETLEQLNALRGQGCAEIQGYYISRPAPAADIAKMLGVERLEMAGAPVTVLPTEDKATTAPQADDAVREAS